MIENLESPKTKLNATMIKNYICALLPLLVALQSTLAQSERRPATEQPNIVFILADDLGWKDTGYNGNPFYETPNIDQLAAAGMTFNRAYSGGPNCAPTRACILSGMYGPRTKIWTPGVNSKGPFHKMKLLVPNRENEKGRFFESLNSMQPDVVSLAEMLNPAGYTTARFGKWHLGQDTQGFDYSSYSGSLDKDYKNEQRGYSDPNNSISITDAGIRFIEQNKDRPFFLLLAHFEVHMPLKADQSVIAKYQRKLASKDWHESWNPKYAAMVEALDTSVGRIRAALTELDLAENTLIIFSSDNGGVGKVTPIAPLKGAKGSFYEGGIRVPTVMVWSGTIPAGTENNTPITSVDFMPSFAELANAELPNNQPIDGTSLVPLLLGQTIAERAIFWHYPLYLPGSSAQDKVIPVAGTTTGYWRAVPSSLICRGNWKLIHFFEDDHVELYKLAEDPAERHNLALDYPEKAAALKEELQQWQETTQAPIPQTINPDFAP